MNSAPFQYSQQKKYSASASASDAAQPRPPDSYEASEGVLGRRDSYGGSSTSDSTSDDLGSSNAHSYVPTTGT